MKMKKTTDYVLYVFINSIIMTLLLIMVKIRSGSAELITLALFERTSATFSQGYLIGVN